MKRCILLVALALWLVSCTSPAPTLAPQATYTPLPTYTPYPTFTLVPIATSELVARPMNTPTPKAASSTQASSSTASCIAWTDASDHLNETTCVRGTVSSASQNGSTFFINFDNTRTSFYGVSFKYTWDNLRGKCIELSGKISPYNGRPQIVIDKQEQLQECKAE